MRPLRISATCCNGVAGDVPHLDALLEWCMSRHVAKDFGLSHADDPRRTTYEPGVIPIPVARRKVPGFDWPVALCSAPIYAVKGDRHDHYARRLDVATDPQMIREDARKVFYVQMGEFKSFRLPLRVRLIERVVWFAVGDRKEVRRLLRDVTCIGKKTSQGYGRVGEWSVEDSEMPEDACWFAPAPGERRPVLMRPLPPGAVPHGLVGFRPFFGGIVPPYWAAEYFADGVTPC